MTGMQGPAFSPVSVALSGYVRPGAAPQPASLTGPESAGSHAAALWCYSGMQDRAGALWGGMRDDYDEAGPDIEFVSEGRKKEEYG